MGPEATNQVSIEPLICSYCHQPIQFSYYFCPNCGNKLHTAPLSTSIETQAWIYAFSIILPMLCFLFITRWPALRYYRSRDPKARQIGIIAFVLIILSTIVTIWLVTVWTQEAIQSQISAINADFGS